jgi:hypothetical protein
MTKITWLEQPEDHDYDAAFDYLRLHFAEALAQRMVKDLRSAAMTAFKSKDIFRASGLELAGLDNFHVEHNIEKIKANKPVSPILLIAGHPMIIADGFHRVSAIYHLSEDAPIPAKIAYTVA